MTIKNLKIVGFGKGTGDKVHAVMIDGDEKIKGNYTLCSINTKSKRSIDIEEEYKSVESVSCAKCMRTQWYKSEVLQIKQKEPEKQSNKKNDKKTNTDNKKTNTDNKKTKPKQKSNKKENKTQSKTKQEQIQLPIETEKNTKQTNKEQLSKETEQKVPSAPEQKECKCNNDCKNKMVETLEEKYIQKIKEIAENFQNGDVHFFAKMKSNFKYKIIHRGSKHTFFDEIPETIILQALSILNNMDSTWDGRHCIPTDFITQCKHAMIAAFKSIGQQYPESLNKIAEEHKYQACKKNKIIIKKLTARYFNTQKIKKIEVKIKKLLSK